MGLLDELKQQADQKRGLVAQAEAEQAARHQAYRENILPRMVKLFTYLSELIDQLNFLDKPVRVSYPIKNYETLSNLEQKDYKIRADSMEAMKGIDFSFECVDEGRVEFQVENKLYIERLEEYLSSVRLNYTCNKYKDSRHNVTSARFRVDNHVTVDFSFAADIEAGVIRLELRNYHGLHTDRFTIDPETIDDAFLDDLGRLIVRQDSKLFQLEISEEERQRIRERLNGNKEKTRKKTSKTSRKKAASKAKTKKSKTKAPQTETVTATASNGSEKSMLAAAVLAGKSLPDEFEHPELFETPPKTNKQKKKRVSRSPKREKSVEPQIDSGSAEQPQAGAVPEALPAPSTELAVPDAFTEPSLKVSADPAPEPLPEPSVEESRQVPSILSPDVPVETPVESTAESAPKLAAVESRLPTSEDPVSEERVFEETDTPVPEPEISTSRESEPPLQLVVTPPEPLVEETPQSVLDEETPVLPPAAEEVVSPAATNDRPSAQSSPVSRDVDDDLSLFELHFSALPAAFNTYESLGDSGQHILQKLTELQDFPAQLLKQAVQVLEGLNKTTLDVDERIQLAAAIFQQVYPVLVDIYYDRAKGKATRKELSEEGLLEIAIEVVDEIATAYKHAFKALYTPDRSRFPSQAKKLTYWGFRVLELLRLEQRLRALRYQKIPRVTWLDCNQVFFSLLLHDAIDDEYSVSSLIGLFPDQERATEINGDIGTVRRVYLSIQLFGVLDVITWPAALFFFPDDYLEELDGGLNIEQDSGEILTPGWLITFLKNDGPPLHIRNDAIPAPALRIDFSGLFARIVEEHENLANMMFLNAVDEDQLSRALAGLDEQDRIPVLEMMLLALQRRERKHTRHAVFGTEKLLVHFGFAACFTNLSGFTLPDGDDREKSVRNVELIQQKSIELAERHPPFIAVPWKILNFSAGGLLVANETSRFNNTLQVGQLAAFKPKDNQDSPLMGFIGRIQRPVDHLTEISIIRMARHAEAAIAQDHSEARKDGGKPVILMQDFDNRWQIIALHDYGYTTGTPLKLIRGNGVRILLRLGDIWMTKRDFTVFEVRSANL